MNEPIDMDKLIAEVLDAAAYRAEMQRKQVPTHVHSETSFLADSAGPLATEVKRLRAEVEDEQKSADLHRRLNERVAAALGLLDMRTDPDTGEEYLPSWHDMPERVTALCSEVNDLLADKHELGLTVAAEIGREEGAPSSRWECDGRHWYADRGDGGMDKIEMYANLNGDGTVTHKRVWLVCDMHGFEEERGRFDLARAAMLAADKALKGEP